jgi:hypothetical protein
MTPMSAEDEAAWVYVERDSARYPDCHGDARAFSSQDILNVTTWIKSNDPELVDYIVSVVKHNEPLGFNGGPNDRIIIRACWATTAIISATAQLFGPPCPRNAASIWRNVWDALAAQGAA